MLTFSGWPIDSQSPPIDLDPNVPNNLAPPIFTLPLTWHEIQEIASAPLRIVSVVTLLAMAAGAWISAWAWSRATQEPTPTRRLRAVVATALFLALSMGLFYPVGENARQTFYPRFADFFRGWLAMDLRSGTSGVRIAYAGTDIPYYLMGADLRNDVRYINVDAHRHWLLHDYHLAALRDPSEPATWPEPRPGWDRNHPDYDALARQSPGRADPASGRDARPTPEQRLAQRRDPRPTSRIERVWADAHPEVFEPVYGSAERDPWFRLYRVKAEGETVAPAGDQEMLKKKN